MREPDDHLLLTLKRSFGFDSFKPLQGEIIADTLAGRDVLALLPTGGGKSVCFQLPALLRLGVTIVVSPLISLMKDQVDALDAAGIAATFVNSSLPPQEMATRMRGVQAGRYRLLYVAPERLMQPAFLGALRQLPLDLIAIDEAHCISEWGHEFRADYRQLGALREHFPRTPMMALTATATEQVRGDIIAQLRMRDVARRVASFNRENLTYRVQRKAGAYDQLLGFLRPRKAESGIVYCHTRKSTESLAERLKADGVPALPYHAGLPPKERSRNQELFVRDEAPVICATIAFGMGINKPNVRFVVHYDMPKSIEGYYQETGRAGRDGLAADCLLLFGKGDAIMHERFIDEKPDAARRHAAQRQLDQMVEYAESQNCRRGILLRYFGEAPASETCAACDNCMEPAAYFDGTSLVRIFLSCVEGVRRFSGFSAGAAHIVDVLAGGNTENVRRWRHTELPEYGAGKGRSRADWTAIARHLARVGLVHRNEERFNVLELTQKGRDVLSTVETVMLPECEAGEETRRAADDGEYDVVLFERLRRLRKRLADERKVAAFIIFSDITLRQMSRSYPADTRAFQRISGVGERKLAEFGPAFMAEIRDHVRLKGRQRFAAAARQESPGDSAGETLRLFRGGHAVENIAAHRGFARSTILGHLAAAAEAGEQVEIRRLISAEARASIEAAFASVGNENLAGVYELLGGAFDYGILRLCRAARRRAEHDEPPGVRERVAAYA